MSSSSYTPTWLTRNLPDLVQDSRLETEALGSCIQHVFYETGRTALERRVRRIEQWVRQGFLGAGAYGTVNLEKCVTDGDQKARLRAVKQIKKYIVPGEELDYARELEAVIKFSHPRYSHCFVTSHGWYESDDSVFITMEYLAYRDLQRYLVRPLPEDEAVQIVAQVLEGLQYMHGNGFVHRDLKPGNIMVVTKSPDWFVKIADFGISKRRRQDVTTLATLQRGTMGFMAPEVLGYTDGGTYTSLVDMWSLGAVAYIVLTSVSPFPTMADLTSYVLRKKGFPAILLQTHHVSELAQDFITKLMICDPNERPTAYSAGQHGWLYTETPRFTEERFHRTEGPQLSGSVLSVESEMIYTMASNAWSTADMTDSLTDTTIQADIPRRSNYQSPSVSEHIAEDDGPFATLPLDSPILLEEVKTGPNPVGERLVAGVPRIIIRDNRDGHLTSPPITGDNPPPVEVPPGSPPLTSEIPILTPTEDSFPDSETGSDVNEGENEDEGYTSSESDEGGNEKVGSTTREGHSGKERMSLEVRCYYCDERFKFRGEGPAELLLCKHWVCHGCLLASFGLSLLDAEYVPRCRCGGDVNLQVFRTVFAAPKVQAAWKFVRDLMGKWQHEPWLCSKGHVGEPIWDPDASTNYLKARCGSCDTSSRKFRLGMRVSTDFCVFCKREGICHCAAERHRITNFLIKRMVFYYHENERLASRAAEMDSAIRCGKYYYWETWEDVKEAIGVEPSDGEEEEDGASVVSETQAVEDEDKEAEKKSPGRDGPTVAENKT